VEQYPMAKPKYLLDSVASIDLFNAVPGSEFLKKKLERAKVYISVITRIEMLAFPKMTPPVEQGIHKFIRQIKVIPLNRKIERNAILIRRARKLKLPDTIIAATALSLGATVISRDTDLLKLNWPGLPVEYADRKPLNVGA
jgi:predicted nucleic acid-binding protein